MRVFQLVVLSLIMGSCNGQPGAVNLKTNQNDNTLLWEVSGNGLPAVSYVFGTFHMLCKEDIKFSDPLKQAVKNSKAIYLELDMDDPATLLGALTLMNMKDRKKLKDLYTAEDYSRLERYFKDSLQMSLSLFQTMKPFFLVALLYPKMMPCSPVSGIEEELMVMAKTEKKEIRGLETMAFQASIFDSIPYERQATELLKTIDSMQTSRQYFDSMLTVYKEQRINDIEALFNKSEFGMEEDQDILLDNRNKNWVGQLKTIMKKEPVFVAVGAGHLVGKMGLIELLRKEGYTVRPLQNR